MNAAKEKIKVAADAVYNYSGITLKEMQQAGKRPEWITFSRNLLIFCLVDVFDFTWSEVSQVVKRDRSSCSRGYNKIVTWSNHAAFKKTVLMLQAKCRKAYRERVVKEMK